MGPPTSYRIRIEGQLGREWTSWFSGLTVGPGPDGTTVLHGQLADQAALHGLLAAIRDLGVSLVSVESYPTGADSLTRWTSIPGTSARTRSASDGRPRRSIP